jgi:hypothetical protein
MNLTRGSFLKTIGLSLTGMAIAPQVLASQDKPAPLNTQLVKEYVGVAHSKLDKVKEMLGNEPQLLHTSFDWGGGDYESAIEAAGHVGNRQIAEFLLSNGARYNVYLACMMGHLEIVKQILTLNPGLLNSKGPHGFTMLHHAQKGGEASKEVGEYLVSLGATQTRIDFYAKG